MSKSDGNIHLSSFPDSDLQALAMLYTKNQDLKGKSIKEIAEIYYNAFYELRYIHKELRSDIKKKFKDE